MLENMLRSLGPYWVIAPILASLATQCGQSPRGALPTTVATVVVRLESVPAPLPADEQELAVCLERMGGVNHVAASWQNEAVTLLTEIAPNVFTTSFNDDDGARRERVPAEPDPSWTRHHGCLRQRCAVPAEFLVTMTVHDENECRRNPIQAGHVTMGVSANGVLLTTVVGGNNALAFVVANDGVVTSPVLD